MSADPASLVAPRLARCLGLIGLLLAFAGCVRHVSPYADQQSPEIQSLSVQDVDDYLVGKGMGLAKAAELNGYPGPAHVLELAGPLGLTAEQRERTEVLFKDMQHRSIEAGRSLIEEERALDRLFAGRTITATALQRSLERIAAQQSRVRQAQLDAHLAQAAILTPQQVALYARLQGLRHGPGRHAP